MPYKKIKPTAPTKSASFERFANAVRISDQWKKYRDTVHRLFLTSKDDGQEQYELMIGKNQLIIKAHQKKYSSKPLDSIIRLGKDLDGMDLAKHLAAGYELIEGNDYCAKSLKSK